MNSLGRNGLLTVHDPVPVVKINPEGRSSFILFGDHAGNLIPSKLGRLGLGATDLQRHIAWDIGVDALGTRLAAALDCLFIRQVYSRLVVDCNRAAVASDCIAESSDGTPVPGNRQLASAARGERIAGIYAPYHQAIAAELSRRDSIGIKSIVIALHSFTARMYGADRPWHIGVLHDGGDPAFATSVLAVLRRTAYVVGDNEPYRMDKTDYTVPRHAYAARRPYVELEIRQDLLTSDTQCDEWAAVIAAALHTAAGTT